MINTPINIFYTDDDPDDQDLFKEAVESLTLPHQVYSQNHGGELIDKLNQPPPKPDLIFLDLNMPHKNGFQVLEEMKANKDFKNIPVIVFSTANSEDTIETCKKLGADMYVTKPQSYPTMLHTIQSLFKIDWKNFNNNHTFVFRA